MEIIPEQVERAHVKRQIEYWVGQVIFAETALSYATEQLEMWSDK